MAEPVRVGFLRDHGGGDLGAFGRLFRLALDDATRAGRLDRDVELVVEHGDGLPSGTAAAVTHAFERLVADDVVVVVGPAISDNGLVARDLADAARLACINYTGGEQTRSEWMFHYQVGSLEEEGPVLARHLASQGVATVALVQDRSPIGRRYAEFFDEAAAQLGLDVAVRTQISPVATDLGGAVERLRRQETDVLVYLGLGLSARPLSLAMGLAGWHPRVYANSALMFGYADASWARGWEGWTYVDAFSDDNPVLADVRARLGDAAPGPTSAAAYDMGRLVAEGIALAPHLDRDGLRHGLERVKLVPSALGRPGTWMGFGRWDRAALKGEYLVLRRWVDGESVEVTA